MFCKSLKQLSSVLYYRCFPDILEFRSTLCDLSDVGFRSLQFCNTISGSKNVQIILGLVLNCVPRKSKDLHWAVENFALQLVTSLQHETTVVSGWSISIVCLTVFLGYLAYISKIWKTNPRYVYGKTRHKFGIKI